MISPQYLVNAIPNVKLRKFDLKFSTGGGGGFIFKIDIWCSYKILQIDQKTLLGRTQMKIPELVHYTAQQF